jgi:hypothetical protein
MAVMLWGLLTLLSLISLAFSVYSLNLWDRLPAVELPRYFSDMTPEAVQFMEEWKNTVQQTGLSLSGYALIFTVSRVIGGASLFLVGFMLIRRYSDHLMAVLMAIALSMFAAAGIWNNPLFPWGVGLAPWLNYPVQFLGWLTWCAAIVIYAFPDGNFIPRWTFWLAALLVPITFIMAFNIDIFLNPDNWPAPYYFLDNILFIGGALVSVIYRYRKILDVEQKQSMRRYVWGISLLIVLYFIYFFMMNVYPFLTGHALFESKDAVLKYVLWSEPIWFAFEAFFAIGLALSVFQDKLMEKSVREEQAHHTIK